jgi:hypothetical protein
MGDHEKPLRYLEVLGVKVLTLAAVMSAGVFFLLSKGTGLFKHLTS